MQNRLELLILKNLFTSDEYIRKVIPYVRDEFFSEREERLIFVNIKEYFEKYNSIRKPNLHKMIPIPICKIKDD